MFFKRREYVFVFLVTFDFIQSFAQFCSVKGIYHTIKSRRKVIKMVVERRKSKRILVDEDCIIFIRGSSIKAQLHDISGTGVSFFVDDQHPFQEAEQYEEVLAFQSESYSGCCEIVRIYTFNVLEKALIGCRRR